MGGDWFDRFVMGIKYPSLIGLGWFLYRITVFVCNFLAGRMDARHARVDELDKRLNVSLGKRLDHLEEAEARNQSRIILLENAVAILLTELRLTDPTNSKLKEVAAMLRAALPIASDHPFDDLLRQAEQRDTKQ
jgi:hypothetical protein